ncbi:outer membrane beta-barrel protein [Flavobacterium album]|nr:outer membrane beta-barrel protein [Flavobacterium album]
MKKLLSLSALLLSLSAWCQKPHDQYSLEAGYGMGISGHPTTVGFAHYEVGFRYMVDEFWGIKFDFGSDSFRMDDNPELGSDYKRYSFQGVHNLGRTLNIANTAGSNINLLAHGGLGYSSLTSVTRGGTDNIGNVIIGLTPQLRLGKSLALTLDTSYILNFTQHYNFDGQHPARPEHTSLKSFTGHLFTASVGFTFYFGKNGSDADWR